MKSILLMGSLIALASTSLASAQGIAADDLDNLRGAWNFVALEVEGSKLPDAMLTGSKIIVKGDNSKSISGGIT